MDTKRGRSSERNNNMKLKVRHIDFEALLKDLPMSNPLILINEISNVYDIHTRYILENKRNRSVKGKK